MDKLNKVFEIVNNFDFEKVIELQNEVNKELDEKTNRLLEIAYTIENKAISEALILLASMQCSYQQLRTLDKATTLTSLHDPITKLEKHIHHSPSGETSKPIIEEEAK